MPVSYKGRLTLPISILNYIKNYIYVKKKTLQHIVHGVKEDKEIHFAFITLVRIRNRIMDELL